jgi:adenine-specific DNA-methyltransferase
MPFDLSYMGTKRQLASTVADIISSAQPGPLLDAFSGMCAVGEAVSPVRNVWNNDAQVFASNVAKCLFQAQEPTPTLETISGSLQEDFLFHLRYLRSQFVSEVNQEAWAIRESSYSSIAQYRSSHSPARFLGEHRRERETAAAKSFPYVLFTLTYSDSYFGLHQSLEIDSLVYAIHQQLKQGILSEEGTRWLLIALGRALKAVATTTGHFAQPLEPSAQNHKRFAQQRRRSIWKEFLDGVETLRPVGDNTWREKNRVFNEDSCDLLHRLRGADEKPAVIYADPPYTDDQYSRYYHVLETLFLYDYPITEAKGRYRKDRFQSSFSVKSRTYNAFEQLISASAALGSDLVLSYPVNGILRTLGHDPRECLRRHYQRVEICSELHHQHSTFGASKGAARAEVTEVIYWARQ